MASNYVRIQIQHVPQPESNPYPEEIEVALKHLGLPEIGWIPLAGEVTQEGVIRHETGPEIITLITSLVTLTGTIMALVNASRKRRPETRIQITVNSSAELQRVLQVLGM